MIFNHAIDEVRTRTSYWPMTRWWNLEHDADGSVSSGKGTPRRKVKRAPARSGTDDKKLQQTLKKLNVQPIQAIEEVNMFKSDGNVIHFAAPKGKTATARPRSAYSE